MTTTEKQLYTTLKKARVNLKIVDRKGWGAVKSHDELEEFEHFPIEIVIIQYANVDFCKDDVSCSQTVRELQKEHLKRGYDDIKWNFMIGGNGRVYEGRGWWFNGVKDELEMQKYEHRSYDIAFLCRPGENNVSRDMENGLNELIKFGIVDGVLQRFYKIIGFKEDSHMVYVDEGVYNGFQAFIW